MITVNTHNARETEALGAKIAEKLCGTEVIALFGGLGMGKTAFTRGLAGALGAGENCSALHSLLSMNIRVSIIFFILICTV